MIATGARPEHLLRLVELYRQCEAALETRDEALDLEGCVALLDRIDEALPGGASGGAGGEDLAAAIDPGLQRSPMACMAASINDPLAAWIGEIDTRAACERAAQSAWGQGAVLSPIGTLMAGSGESGALDRYAPHTAGPESIQQALEGYDLVGRDDFDAPTTEGDSTTYVANQWQTSWEYETEDGSARATLTESSRLTSWDEAILVENGVQVSGAEVERFISLISQGEDGLTTNTYDGDGNILSSEFFGNDGSSYQATYDDEGNVTASMSVQVVNGQTTIVVAELENGEVVKATTLICSDGACICKENCMDPAQGPDLHPGTENESEEGDDDCGFFAWLFFGCDDEEPEEEGTESEDETGSEDQLEPDYGVACRKDPRQDLWDVLGNAAGDVATGDAASGGRLLGPDPRLVRWVDPEIGPGTPAPLLDACMLELIESGRQETCPPSVMQCVDPAYMTDHCGCGFDSAPTLDLESEIRGGVCAAIRCAEGSRCNPATALCEVEDAGAVDGGVPGVMPPPPFGEDPDFE